MLKQESITFHNQNQYEIELDCIAVKVEYEPWEAIEKISSIIWDNSPLLGELIMGAEEINELLSAGMHIFKKIMSNPHAMLTRMEQQLLIHSCVVLTQEQERETSDGKLWDYILERLGYDKTKNHYSWQSIYKSLADQIEEGFQSRKKVFSDGGHKYYNSLRLHALAPSWTLENLINILYHFYEKNLEYQYIESDNSYHIFVDQIAKRWSGTNQCEKELKLRSDHIAASFRTLFVYRPQYMAAICDALTFRINEILKGERDLFNDNNRWDVAVIQWYQKKTEKERQKMEQATKRAYRERVVIHADEIHPSYYLEGEKLFVQLPRIRLPEITERPIVRLYQGDREIASQRLSVFGDELCLTTREHSFCISDLQNINWELPLHFSISLQCAGLLLYDSKHELYRDYLLFLDSGKETKKIHSNVTRQYFFTNDSMNIEIYDEAENDFSFGSIGQLYELCPSTLKKLYFNGIDLLYSGYHDITWYFSETPVKDVVVLNGERTYFIFKKTPILHVDVKRQDYLKNYFVRINGETRSLYEYRKKSLTAYIVFPEQTIQHHYVEICNFSTGHVVCSFDYCIIPEFVHEFLPIILPAKKMRATLILKHNGYLQEVGIDVGKEQNDVVLSWNYGLKLKIAIPRLRIHCGERNLFEVPSKIWYEEFSETPFLYLSCPNTVSVTMFLNGNVVPQKKKVFDIGGALRRLKEQKIASQRLEILVRSKSEVIMEMFIADVLFSPEMSGSPIIQDGREIRWNPKNVYCGYSSAQFCVVLENDVDDEPWEYNVDLEPQILEQNFPCKEGTYLYRVILYGKETVFGGEVDRLLYSGKIKITIPDEERFHNKNIRLTSVTYGTKRCWTTETVKISRGNAQLTDIEYIEHSIPLDGELPAYQEPCATFEAYLQFKHSDGRWIDFNYNEDNLHYYLINPVKFWIAFKGGRNQSILIQGKDGKRLLIYCRHNGKGNATIVNRILDNVEKEHLKRADRFTYVIEET